MSQLRISCRCRCFLRRCRLAAGSAQSRVVFSIFVSGLVNLAVLLVLARWLLPARDGAFEPLLVASASSELVPDALPDELPEVLDDVAFEVESVGLTTVDVPEFPASASVLEDPDFGLEAGVEGSFALGSAGPATGIAGSGLGTLISDARKNGLDIVIVFDSTNSMHREIASVRFRIATIATALLEKVPSARVSLVTYRDRSDEYLVRGLPLTDQISELMRFLRRVAAGGGGDAPEAVDAGLAWAMQYNAFRPAARKVILLFGDAPPHAGNLGTCLELAETFHSERQGHLSTVTCQRVEPLPEFYAIARAGGGEAHTSTNTRWLMEELLILVFGTEHREEVIDFFGLDPKMDQPNGRDARRGGLPDSGRRPR